MKPGDLVGLTRHRFNVWVWTTNVDRGAHDEPVVLSNKDVVLVIQTHVDDELLILVQGRIMYAFHGEHLWVTL